MRTLFVDIMQNGRFVFALRYRYRPAFRISMEDVYSKVLEKRPSLKGKHIEMYID